MNDSRLLQLIELTYAAAEDRQLWQPLLASTAQAVGGVGACVISHDLVATGEAAVLAGFDPEALILYNEYYHALDAWALAPQASWRSSAGRAVPDQTILPRRDLEKTEFYEFVRRLGISRMMHASFESGEQGVMGISVYRSESEAPFEQPEVQFLEALVPHLRRSLRLHDVVARASREKGAALDGLDAVAHGVLLVTADARVGPRQPRRMLDTRSAGRSDPRIGRV